MQFVHHKTAVQWRPRLRASGLHLAISLAIACLAALLVFGLWYPYPYREISGGRELFLIVVTVDVILGPLITLAVFNTGKSRRELAMDLSLVAAIQLAALAYGLWTVAMARPVHLVFEFDRFRVVHRIEVDGDLLARAPPSLQGRPWGRPTSLAVRPFRNNEEQIEATFAALQGVSLSSRPDLWESYADAKPRILAAAKPAAQLKTRFPDWAGRIDQAAAGAGLNPASAVYLPMVGRKTFWTVLLDPATAEVGAFLPLDSF